MNKVLAPRHILLLLDWLMCGCQDIFVWNFTGSSPCKSTSYFVVLTETWLNFDVRLQRQDMRDVIYKVFKGFFHFISTLKVSRVDMKFGRFFCWAKLARERKKWINDKGENRRVCRTFESELLHFLRHYYKHFAHIVWKNIMYKY